MSKLKLIATNLFTAVLTAAATSAFWIVAFNNGEEREQAKPPAPAAAPAELELGPTGLAIPVVGIKPAQLANTFKQARAAGARVHDAIDIMAPHGTPVVASAPGKLEKLFFSKGGGGVTAYVSSPDRRYMFYYAHLRDYAAGLKEGQIIKQGDLIGTVGSTGNANPAGPHLHFAIHRRKPGDKWYQGEPLNPYPLLVGKQTGG